MRVKRQYRQHPAVPALDSWLLALADGNTNIATLGRASTPRTDPSAGQ